MPRRGALFLAAAAATLQLLTAQLAAAAPRSGSVSDQPVRVQSPETRPLGFTLTAGQAERIAAGIPSIAAEVRHHGAAHPAVYTKGSSRWQISWFTASGKEIAQVIINDATGAPTEAWTGFQVAWPMARGNPGAFGHKLNHPWFWIPMCVVFVLPFLRLRGRRPTLLHLDLLMLLGFSVSLAFFNEGDLGLSVPLAYPFLLYLLVRALLLGFGRGRPREPLRLLVPVSWLAIAVVALVGFRVWMNVSESGVIDVGYAGVIGADRLLHDKPLYGGWPSDNATGDTYGPVNYLAYVPFRAAFGWSGRWDDLPAGHAAAIVFDLLTLAGVFLLGRRVRGPTFGIVLAYAWAAYPFTLYASRSPSRRCCCAAPTSDSGPDAWRATSARSPGYPCSPCCRCSPAERWTRSGATRSRGRPTARLRSRFGGCGEDSAWSSTSCSWPRRLWRSRSRSCRVAER